MNDSSRSRPPIRVPVDPDLLDLIPGFLEHRREETRALAVALETGDLDAVYRIGHSLKGVGGGYGFPAITRIGSEIGEAARNGHSENAAQLLEELEDYLARVEPYPDSRME